jgi:hypothetical protein
MWFDCRDAVRSFAGDDHERAVVPEAARAVLARFDAGRSTNSGFHFGQGARIG